MFDPGIVGMSMELFFVVFVGALIVVGVGALMDKGKK